MKNILLGIFTIFVIHIPFSCTDILETNPVSTITVNSFWQSEEDAIGGLFGIYNQFRLFAEANLILLGEARSEVMGHGIQNADFRIKYFENTLSEIDADLSWQQLYRIVNYANLIIKYVPQIDFNDEAEKDGII